MTPRQHMRFVLTTRAGRKWEHYAQKLLLGATLTDHNCPYDLLWHDKRIEVKSSRLHIRKKGKYWNFMIKRNTECDYFLLIGCQYHRDAQPMKIYFIPTELIDTRYTLTIGPNHKGQWAKYEIRKGDQFALYLSEAENLSP